MNNELHSPNEAQEFAALERRHEKERLEKDWERAKTHINEQIEFYACCPFIEIWLDQFSQSIYNKARSELKKLGWDIMKELRINDNRILTIKLKHIKCDYIDWE